MPEQFQHFQMKVSFLILFVLTRKAMATQRELMSAKYSGRVVLINYFKHKWDRNYFLSATVKGKYEVKLAENNIRRYRRETAFNHQGLYRDHFFDFPNELQSHRVRRDDITTGLASLRTNPGIRVFFHTNEQTILPEIRGGREVKGFTLEKNIY